MAGQLTRWLFGGGGWRLALRWLTGGVVGQQAGGLAGWLTGMVADWMVRWLTKQLLTVELCFNQISWLVLDGRCDYMMRIRSEIRGSKKNNKTVHQFGGSVKTLKRVHSWGPVSDARLDIIFFG